MDRWALLCWTICLFVHASSSESRSIRNLKPDRDGADVMMREDAEEIFYNVDLEKYNELGITCPTPVAPDNGYILGEGVRVGSVVYVQCNHGYHLSGPTVMACVPIGEGAGWNAEVDRSCAEGETYFNEDEDRLQEEKGEGVAEEHNHEISSVEPMTNFPSDDSEEINRPRFIDRSRMKLFNRNRNPEEEDLLRHVDRTASLPSACRDRPEKGPCHALHKRFFFNSAVFECQPFFYGGCQGNRNNFESFEECNTVCLNSQATEE